ncbi:unnamed protein product [Calicophoron daubneyi]|uniref:Phosphotransferase n=1 Tax=Calicophoron daubneyi TaxID=300641 RepID=A0AAV2TK97_CALDB
MRPSITDKERFKSIRSLRSLDVLNTSRKEGETFADLAKNEIKNLCGPFIMSNEKMEAVMNTLNEQIENGLCKSPNGLRLVNTFVTEISTLREPRKYIALDFKGQYYRVSLTTVSRELDDSSMEETLYTIPKKIRSGPSEEFFNFIAETVYDFLLVRGMVEQELDMAMCFVFPVEQKSLEEAYSVRWAKEFSVPSVIGKDVVKCLSDALKRTGLKIHVRALINDTVGVLAACAAKDSECAMGLIVSTGTNCSYFELTEKVKFDLNLPRPSKYIVLNTEWGAFGDNGCLNEYLTEFDKAIDENSSAPGQQIFEKMCSTLYIGEICRFIIVKAIGEKLIFGGDMPEKLTYSGYITSQNLFEIDRDPPQVYSAAEIFLRERLKINLIRKSDLVNIRFIVRAVVTRSASLLGAACACLINRMKRRRVTLAVDGAFFRFSSSFPVLLVEAITQLIPYSYTFKLKLIDDGDTKGAAAVAATAVHEERMSQLGIPPDQ